MITIFGIKNCDTMKKAFKWLDANGLEYRFHDYRKDGINEEMVKTFVDQLGLDLVLNRRGTTWRKLPEDVKDSLNEADAVKLLCENEAMIKRPIFDLGDHYAIGFSRKDQDALESKLVK